VNKLKKICYSFGAVATALSYQAFSTYIIFFYVDILRLNASLAAIAMLIYGVWNAINDPIAGFISDSTKTRWGRRIPYIALGSIPFGLAYFLLWAPPVTAMNMTALFWYFLIFICLFDALYTVVVINWASLYPEMYPSLAERAQVNSYRQIFGMIGLVVGIALPPLIYITIGWAKMGAIFGAIIAIACLVSLLGSRENMEYSSEKPLPLKAAISATFRNFPFITFVASNLLIQYAFTMVLAIIPFYAKYVLSAGALETSTILFSAFVIAIPMMFVWRAASVKYGAKASYLSAIMIFLISLVPFLFISGIRAAVVSSGFLGIGLAGIILLSDILISDVIDYDATKTSARREGMYFGVNAFICRFAIALEAASIGFIFTFTKYNPVIFTQTKAFLLGLRILVAGLPIVALAIAFGIMMYYPLDSARGEPLSKRPG
jgi:GPH family glycoside/pentoside/hexuronide:cation symporter